MVGEKVCPWCAPGCPWGFLDAKRRWRVMKSLAYDDFASDVFQTRKWRVSDSQVACFRLANCRFTVSSTPWRKLLHPLEQMNPRRLTCHLWGTQNKSSNIMFWFTSLACSFSVMPFVVTITNCMEWVFVCCLLWRNASILFSSSLSYCLVINNAQFVNNFYLHYIHSTYID